MVDHPDILGIETGAPISEHRKKSFNIKEFCKVYLSTITRWFCVNKSPSRSSKPFSRADSAARIATSSEVHEELGRVNGVHSFRFKANSSSSSNFYKQKSIDHSCQNVSPPLSRTGSRKISSTTPSFVHRSASRRRATDPNSLAFTPSFSRNASRRSTNHIMFSNSSGMLKPPPIEQNLECTLEELCYGCTKRITVKRDILTFAGEIIKEEEKLKIQVEPGWRRGTKIKFEGIVNERLRMYPADVNFVISEKQHPLFMREGDDLEMAVEIPLVKALTGGEISVPLLGGEQMSLPLDDIIYPGYEMIIEGQGMPITKEHGSRGNLKLVFSVDFPKYLTDEQRSSILSMLDGCCWM